MNRCTYRKGRINGEMGQSIDVCGKFLRLRQDMLNNNLKVRKWGPFGELNFNLWKNKTKSRTYASQTKCR